MSDLTFNDIYEQADDVLRYSGFRRSGNTYSDSSGNRFSVILSMNDKEVVAEIGMRDCMGMVGYIDQFETAREARNFFLYLAAEIELKALDQSLLTKTKRFIRMFKTVLHMR